MLLSLLGPRALSILADIMASGAILAAFYGIARVSYTRTYGAWPDNRWTRFGGFVVELFTNVVGAVNKAKILSGDAPILVSPEVVAKDAEIAHLRATLILAAAAPPSAVAHVSTLPPPGMGAPSA